MSESCTHRRVKLIYPRAVGGLFIHQESTFVCVDCNVEVDRAFINDRFWAVDPLRGFWVQQPGRPVPSEPLGDELGADLEEGAVITLEGGRRYVMVFDADRDCMRWYRTEDKPWDFNEVAVTPDEGR